MPQKYFCLATEDDRSALSQLDYLLCRNVEVISANEDDVQDNAHADGSCDSGVIVGQVGLQCMHCSLSPFATARYAIIFPESINHIGDSLRMMAKCHFSRCAMTPSNVRKDMQRELFVMQKVIEDGTEEKSMRSLKEFCVSIVAKRLNLQNLHLYNTGVIFSNRRMEERPRESQKTPFRQPDPRWLPSEDMHSSAVPRHSSQQYSSPTQHETSPTQHRQCLSLPSLQSAYMAPHNMTVLQSPIGPQTVDRCMLMCQSSFPSSKQDNSDNFFRESMGWSCRHCSSVPFQFRAPSSFYPYVTAPPPSYIEHHLRLCAGTRSYQQPIHHSYPNPSETNQDAALNYLASVSNYDSLLVLDEDRVLLSDYFFYLIKQLQLCRFVESDRKSRGGKRGNVKVGFGGLECRHCALKVSLISSRKFFWSNVDRLANSFAEIPSHILNCSHFPDMTKKSLLVLKIYHKEQMAKLPRGSQKVFFRRMWRRLHMHSSAVTEEDAKNDEFTFVTPVEIPKPPISRISLAIPEDKDWLSDTDYFVRRNLEVFCASHDDVLSAQTDNEITIGQVGIRCIHCASTSEGACGHAVKFPFSTDSIYEGAMDLQKLHLVSCINLPANISQEIANLKTSASLSSVSKRYYIIAAKELGIIDTPEGMRMSRNDLSNVSTGDSCLKIDRNKIFTESSSSMTETVDEKDENSSQKRKALPLKRDSKDYKR